MQCSEARRGARYSALAEAPGGGWRLAEGLAAALGSPADLPSRAALALLHTLQLAAAKSGHSYLPWATLATQTERLMGSTGALLHRPSARASRAGSEAQRGAAPWTLGRQSMLRCSDACTTKNQGSSASSRVLSTLSKHVPSSSHCRGRPFLQVEAVDALERVLTLTDARAGRAWHSRDALAAVARALAAQGKLVLERPGAPLAVAPLALPALAPPPAAASCCSCRRWPPVQLIWRRVPLIPLIWLRGQQLWHGVQLLWHRTQLIWHRAQLVLAKGLVALTRGPAALAQGPAHVGPAACFAQH
jgi:hypothetical protein